MSPQGLTAQVDETLEIRWTSRWVHMESGDFTKKNGDLMGFNGILMVV